MEIIDYKAQYEEELKDPRWKSLVKRIRYRDNDRCQICRCQKKKGMEMNVHHLESRKTGGNAPNNLITLCETCHKAYHRGEIQLKAKRGTSLRDAAVMSIMRGGL